SNPFGKPTVDEDQMSLYASYTTQTASSPPANTAPPGITGTAQQGQTLTEQHGEWSNSPTGYSYQWQQCNGEGSGCTHIAGASNDRNVPTDADVVHPLRVQETASNAGGSGGPASAEATAVVFPEGAQPSNETPPTITGTPQQGQTLTEHRGSWTKAPTSFAYQWLRCNGEGSGCTPIAGASKQTYEVSAGDVGHTIRVQEEASNAFGAGSPATSEATAVVTPLAPANVSAPTISGTAQQGQTLTETHGTWTNEPTSYSYQWQQCNSLGEGCLPISGAISQTYVPTAADVEHTLRVQETASNSGGASSPASSAQSAVVKPTAPTIHTAHQSQTLTETHGTWTNEPTSYSYQWQHCNTSGDACLAITGATAQTYTLASADVEHTLRVQVTASNSGGASSPASSAQT